MTELWVLPAVWERTVDLMQPYADRAVEAGCFWYGIRSGSASFALTVGIPAQINRRLNFDIPRDSLAELVSALPASDLAAVAQIHTHPGEAVDHSGWDDGLVVSRKVSAIVLPRYGRRPCPLASVGVHRFTDGEWRRLGARQAAEHVRILPDMLDTRR